ncbi:hypothetical protein P3T73_13845 [Kiritimatiellota bacterium B12222]|nr:hypothetical protein P3T73_13845 [Kiritimatiellota bacterium B12222]
MPYEVNDAISFFLPPESKSVQPLDYDWDEATNAIIFTSDYDPGSFSKWLKGLSKHYTQIWGASSQVFVEDDDDLGCVSFWMTREKGVHPMSKIQIDSHVAYTKIEDSFENLNAWIGSELLSKLMDEDKPSTIGMIRFRPEN